MLIHSSAEIRAEGIESGYVSATRSTKAAGVRRHLLFVAVLALSVFAMHTLGHPDSRSGSHAAALPAHTAVTGPMAMKEAPGGHAAPSDPVAGTGTPQLHAAAPPVSGPLEEGMDPASVCVAILGSMLLAALVRGGPARRRMRQSYAPSAVGALLRPDPPPPRGSRLAQVSVLRI